MNCPPCKRSPGIRRQRGAALIVALLVFALCAALIAAMQGELTRVYQRGANLFLAEQGYAYRIVESDSLFDAKSDSVQSGVAT